jgi:hypothetical protein
VLAVGYTREKNEADRVAAIDFVAIWGRLLLSTALRKGLGRHLDGVVRDLGLVLNSEEMALDFFQDRRIVVDHAALPANLNRGVGNKQVFSAMAVKVFDAPFLIAVTATEITAFRFH